MNTPAHVIIEMAALTGGSRRPRWKAVVLGSLVPDLPMFGFFLWESFVIGTPQSILWNETYFLESWQLLFDLFNSIPIGLLGLALAWRWPGPRLFFAALILHALTDLPLHYDDGHRHFLPLSIWRFESPVSYWDPRHNGAFGAGLECALVVVCSALLWRRYPARSARALFVAAALTSLAGYLAFFYFSADPFG